MGQFVSRSRLAASKISARLRGADTAGHAIRKITQERIPPDSSRINARRGATGGLRHVFDDDTVGGLLLLQYRLPLRRHDSELCSRRRLLATARVRVTARSARPVQSDVSGSCCRLDGEAAAIAEQSSPQCSPSH